ncbi:transmembrane protein 72-like [Ylistrum balloti]|uniref:transmembrane protein 72-like n=1 Tax=Ylistrum balloti TaxID=509963 RepID=UPI002905A36F|nr:transmembrane protein 72-like [Ylistrum balloti]
MENRDGKCAFCLWEFYYWLCRFWGIITAIALWGISVEEAFYGRYVGFILLIEAVIVTSLEVVFFIDICVKIFKSNDDDEESVSCCLKMWACVLWLDNWKKGVFYLLLAVPCFIEPNDAWLAIISGVMLIMSAIFYVIKTFGSMNEDTHQKLPQETTYDRFDDIQEDLEDNILNPIDDGAVVCVADQQEILEL